MTSVKLTFNVRIVPQSVRSILDPQNLGQRAKGMTRFSDTNDYCDSQKRGWKKGEDFLSVNHGRDTIFAVATPRTTAASSADVGSPHQIALKSIVHATSASLSPSATETIDLRGIESATVEELRERLEAAEVSRLSLIASLEDMEAEILKRTSDVRAANQALQDERTLLESKNIALREVLEQIEQHKQQAGKQLQTNINRVVRPMLHILSDRLSAEDKHLIRLVDSTLKDLMDPFVGKVDDCSTDLTRREMEVCTMIRNGFTSKQIASVLKTSVFTVHNQRRSIRRKLRIDDGHTNLESYLKNL
jgi:DNA-binding NarL/FixJ family response regulator